MDRMDVWTDEWGGWVDRWAGRCVLCTPACSVYVCLVCLVQVSEEAIVTFATGASRTQIKVEPM